MLEPAPPPPVDPSPPRNPRQYTGNSLISNEELAEAVKHNDYINQVEDHIQQDRAYIKQLTTEIGDAMKPIRRWKGIILRTKERIYNRNKQKLYLIKQLRIKMAYDKIAKIRKEIGVN